MMPAFLVMDGADQIRRELQYGVFREVGCQALLWQLDSIPGHAGEADLEFIALRADSLDLDGLPRRLRRGDDGLGREVEGDAKHIGVFDVEQFLLVQVVGLPPQGPADDLFAEQLGAESAHAEHMGDGVGVPALGEHGHRYDAADGIAESTQACRPCS
jgi:hypothetical protein